MYIGNGFNSGGPDPTYGPPLTTNSTTQVVPFDIVDFDPNYNLIANGVNTLGISGAGYTAPASGYYFLSAQGFFHCAGNTLGQAYCQVAINGSVVRTNINMRIFPSGINDFLGSTVSTILTLAIGDLVQFAVVADVGASPSGGGTTNFYAASGQANWFEISMLSMK